MKFYINLILMQHDTSNWIKIDIDNIKNRASKSFTCLDPLRKCL
jgi:hypothetical protein